LPIQLWYNVRVGVCQENGEEEISFSVEHECWRKKKEE
jgi:hypothetical protein